MRRALKSGLALLAAAALVAAGLAYEGYRRVQAPGPLGEPASVVIAAGSGVAGIAGQLAAEGVIDSPNLFRIVARLDSRARTLKAGEYVFPAGISLKGAIDLLERGETVVRRVTVPEGLTSTAILARLADAPALSGEVADLPPEGSLLPETYHYQWGDSREMLVERMRASMQSALAELWPTRADDLPFATPEEAVVLASIVEKETAVAAERPLVAGVFINRLRRGMRLQSDPTVAYALTGGAETLDRALTRADWAVDSPYNTYRNAGLPPGPIANPGREALAAVLRPVETDYLYFVADGSGGHAFAKTLAEHNRNVARWRRLRDGGS
jgi:UPF0755 protein